MVDRLITSLRALESCATDSRERSRCVEIALDFADALLLVSDCPQVELTPAQRAALERLDEHLQGMTGHDRTGVQTRARPHEPESDWATAGTLATDALRALGHRPTPQAGHMDDREAS